jgi:hypothetical protein
MNACERRVPAAAYARYRDARVGACRHRADPRPGRAGLSPAGGRTSARVQLSWGAWMRLADSSTLARDERAAPAPVDRRLPVLPRPAAGRAGAGAGLRSWPGCARAAGSMTGEYHQRRRGPATGWTGSPTRPSGQPVTGVAFNRLPYLPPLRSAVRRVLGPQAFSYPVKVLRAVYPERPDARTRGRYVHCDYAVSGVQDMLTSWMPLMDIPVRLGGRAVRPGGGNPFPPGSPSVPEPGWPRPRRDRRGSSRCTQAGSAGAPPPEAAH